MSQCITIGNREDGVKIVNELLSNGNAVALWIGALVYNSVHHKEASYLLAGGIEKRTDFGITEKCWQTGILALCTKCNNGTVKVEAAIMDYYTLCVTGGSQRVNEITDKVEEELIEVANKLGIEFKHIQRFE